MRINYLFTTFKRLLLPFALSLSLVASLVPSPLAHAVPADILFINPESQSNLYIGNEFDANIRSYVDNETGTVTVSGTVTYPADKLQVLSTPTSNSDFGAPQITRGSGSVTFSASRPEGGGPKIFTIKFKAISSGQATVGFSADSRINGTEPTRKTGAFTITNPNPPPSSSTPPKPSTPKPSSAPVVTAPPTNSPVPSTGPVVTPDPTGLIDSVNISSMYSSAKVTWNVNATNSTSTFTYGFTTSQLDKKITPVKKDDGSFEANIPNLTPGTRYIFYVTATGGDGKSGNYTSTIFTRGYPVTVNVTENGKAVTKGQIRIGTTSSQITSTGVATVGLAAGSYTGTITTDTASLAINLTVEAKKLPADGSAPESQTFSFGLTSSLLEQGPGSGEAILTFVLVIVGGSIVLAMAFVGFMAYRRKKFESDDGVAAYRHTGPSVVIDDGYTWHEPEQSSPSSNTPIAPTDTEHHGVQNNHNNSVYFDEDEPVDMFDQAADKLPQLQNDKSTQSPASVTGQNPNLPHSTTP